MLQVRSLAHTSQVALCGMARTAALGRALAAFQPGAGRSMLVAVRPQIPTVSEQSCGLSCWRWEFDTIRDDILGRYAPVAELIHSCFPDDPRGIDAFRYALELYLRALPNLEVAVDGWVFLRVVEETPTALRAVGICEVLPSGELPIDAQFRLADDSVEYRVLVGISDYNWNSLSESQRWKAVYRYATDGISPTWNWDVPVVGNVDK